MNQLTSSDENISRIFNLLGQPARLKIVLALGYGEACVCHLRQAPGYRQAYISQQLMLLREGNILSTRRIGRHIYYRLTNPALLDLVKQTAILFNMPLDEIKLTSTESCEYIPCSQTGKPF